MSIDRFSEETIKEIGYYVYRLVDPRNGQTFYVGKGKGNRVFAHVNVALENYAGENYTYDSDKDVSTKLQTIREIKNENLEVIHIIQRWGIENENVAFEVEAALMDAYNVLTNIKSGHGYGRGAINAETLEQNMRLEEYDEPDFNYLIIKITDQSLRYNDSNVYETTRKSWKIDIKRANRQKYIFSVLNGVVIDVYENCKWEKSESVEGRAEFEGVQASEKIRNSFCKKKVPSKYRKKGASNPIRYANNK